MFKTTPRSTLMGGDLIRKSAIRVYIDEEGNIRHFDDSILAEHENAYEHEDFFSGEKSRVDRAPFGKQEDGHFHAIDALLEHIMRLVAKNGFSPEQFSREDAIRTINTMIYNHNLMRRQSEGEDTINQVPHFGSPSWRKLVFGGWAGEPKEGEILNHRAHPRHGMETIVDVNGNEINVPRMITATLKKDNVRHDYADRGQYVDAGYLPIYDVVGDVMPFMNEYFKQQMGLGPNDIGPLHDPNGIFMRDFTQPAIKPSAMSSGQVFGIRTKDYNELLRTGRLPNEYAERHDMYSGQQYQPAESYEPAHNVSHGGVHYPAGMLLPSGKSRPEEKRSRANEIRAFLNQVIQQGGENGKVAAELLLADRSYANRPENKDRKPMLDVAHSAPALTHFFGGGGSKASSTGKAGFGSKEKRDRATGRVRSEPTYLSRVAADLGVSGQSINNVHSGIQVNLGGHAVGKQTRNIIHNLHALHAAHTNELHAQGVEDAAAQAAEKIRSHGYNELNPNEKEMADYVRRITDLYAGHHGLANPIQGRTEEQRYDTSQLYNAMTPESAALQDMTVQRAGAGNIETSFDTYVPDINQIQKSFETLQISSATKDAEVMKHVKKGYSINSYNDIRSFAASVGLTTQDVQGIVSTKGDWDVLAKQWNVSPLIVKATKVTFGGV